MNKDKLIDIDNNFYQKLTIKEPFIKILKIITNLASTKYFVLLCFILLLFPSKKIIYLIIILLIINSLLITTFKHIFKRKRPNIRRLVKEKGYSYPSGHTMSATCFYGFLIYLIILSSLLIPIKIFLIIFLILLIIVIAFSRIYLGVHYLSDTIGAFLISTSYLLLYVYTIHFILNFI